MDVPQRHPSPVQEPSDVVGATQHDEPYPQQGEPETPKVTDPGQAIKPQAGHRQGENNQVGVRGQGMAGLPFGVHKRRPAGGAAEDFGQVQPPGDHGGVFNIVGEWAGVAAQNQEGQDPPQANQHRPQAPHHGESYEPPPERHHEPPQEENAGRGAGGQGGGGIHRPHHADGQHRHGDAAQGEPAGDERPQHPGSQHDRPGFRRNGGERAQHPGGKGIKERGPHGKTCGEAAGKPPRGVGYSAEE